MKKTLNNDKFQDDPIGTLANYFVENEIDFIPQNVAEILSSEQLEYLQLYALQNNLVDKLDTLLECQEAFKKSKNSYSNYWDIIAEKYVRVHSDVALNEPNRYINATKYKAQIEDGLKYRQKYWDPITENWEDLYKEEVQKHHIHWRTYRAKDKQ